MLEWQTALSFTGWDDFRLFLAVSETGSFSGAASRLGVSQPTISRRIEHLEHHLNGRRFDRLPDGVVLTNEAKSILSSARHMEDAVSKIQRKISGCDDRMEGTVRISVTDGLAAYWMTPHLAVFQKTYPKISIEFACSVEPADALKMETDVSIRFRRPEEVDLVALRLGTLHFVPWASPAYLDQHGVPRTPEELRNHRLLDHIAYYDDDGDWSSWFAVCRDAKLINYRTNSSSAFYIAIQNGLGIGLLPTYACECTTGIVPLDVGVRTQSHIWLA